MTAVLEYTSVETTTCALPEADALMLGEKNSDHDDDVRSHGLLKLKSVIAAKGRNCHKNGGFR